MAELGCFASTPTFSSTIPFACDEPPVGEVLKMLPIARLLYDLSAYDDVTIRTQEVSTKDY
jgi:hypothetical protein